MIRFACSYEGSHTYLTAPAGRFTVLKKAKALWDNHDISGDEAAKRAGVSKRTLARYFGKRNTPAFGKALNMRRGKQ